MLLFVLMMVLILTIQRYVFCLLLQVMMEVAVAVVCESATCADSLLRGATR